MAFIEAYVTNLGKYNEGELASEPLKFPTTTEEVQALLKRIGVDNIQYEEIFIADYGGDLPELNACLGEYESIDELNHLACLLSELDKSDLEKFEAAVASGEHTSGVGDLINLVENLDCYDFYIGVSDDETLGRIYAEDMELINIPENLRDYFDYEAYGRDMRINEDGGFVKGGFFLPNGSQFIEYYHGLEDIPDDHKVFAYQQMAQCKAIYDKHAETIMGNMDSVVFLGGRESSTIKEISENWLGKSTIYMQTDGRSKGQSESYNQNTQRLGRELMTPAELATMPGDRCILQLRGLPPFYSPKYDLKQHPNYKYTAEADKVKNAFSLDQLINRRRRPGLSEACEVYEADGTDTGPIGEDEDILNYDDVDDPDAYV